MNAIVYCCPSTRNSGAIRPAFALDPLEHDDPADEVVVASRRALCRVATVAAEAGARFQREASAIDPMDWMLAPRRMFDGEAPLDACLRREPYLKGVLVHGLGLDLDMEGEEIDDLLDGVDMDFEATGGSVVRDVIERPPGRTGVRDPRLFSAAFAYRDGRHTVHAFHASLATDEGEIAERLFRRFGASCADATVVDGFDPREPIAEALVAPAVARTLALVAATPGSPLAAGLDVTVEQRLIG